MPPYIKDDATARLVDELAKQRGLTKQETVKLAVQAEFQRATEAVPLRLRFAALREDHKLPPPTRCVANKAFLDDLSGGV